MCDHCCSNFEFLTHCPTALWPGVAAKCPMAGEQAGGQAGCLDADECLSEPCQHGGCVNRV